MMENLLIKVTLANKLATQNFYAIRFLTVHCLISPKLTIIGIVIPLVYLVTLRRQLYCLPCMGRSMVENDALILNLFI